jgi:hypothetical protein
LAIFSKKLSRYTNFPAQMIFCPFVKRLMKYSG